MIQVRVMLRALAYVLHGRADWLESKASVDDNRKAAISPAAAAKRRPGQLAEAERVRRQAANVGRLSHNHERGDLRCSARLVGLAIARATGDLTTGDQLRAEMAAVTDPGVREIVEALVTMGVLLR